MVVWKDLEMADNNIATKPCKNCTRDIPIDNIDLHSIYCERNIRKCTLCDEAVQVDEMAKHHQEVHAYGKCPKCTARLLGSNMASHLERECPMSVIKCFYCELELPRCEMKGHENYCGSRTDPCECGAYVMYKYQKLHQESNHTFIKLDDEYDPGPSKAKPSNQNISKGTNFGNDRTGHSYFPQELKNLDRGSSSNPSQNVQQNQHEIDGERAKYEPGSYRPMPTNQKQIEASIGNNRTGPGNPPHKPETSDGRSFSDNRNVMQNQQMHRDRGEYEPGSYRPMPTNQNQMEASIGNNRTGPGNLPQNPEKSYGRSFSENRNVIQKQQMHGDRGKFDSESYMSVPPNQNIALEAGLENNRTGSRYQQYGQEKFDHGSFSNANRNEPQNSRQQQQMQEGRARIPELVPHFNRNVTQNQPMNFDYCAPPAPRDDWNINNYHNNKPIDTKSDTSDIIPLTNAIKDFFYENKNVWKAREQSPQDHLPKRNNEMPQMTSNVENRSDDVRRGSFPSNRFQRGGYKKQPAPQPPNSKGPNPNYKRNYNPNHPHSNYEDNASGPPHSYNNYRSQDDGGGSNIERNENYNQRKQNYPNRRGRGNFQNKSNSGRGRGGRAYGCGSSFNQPPPNEDPKRDRASESAIKRAQAEERERREQNSYNLANGLPPVLSAAEKIEKLRNMSAKFNNEGKVDYSKVLNNRMWSAARSGTATSRAPDTVYYSSPESSEDEAPRMNLSHLNPMTEREMSTRVASHLQGSSEPRIARNFQAMTKSSDTRGVAAARKSAVLSPHIRKAQPGEALLPCEFCGESIPMDDFVIHETGCKQDLVQSGAPQYGWGQLYDNDEQEEKEDDALTQPADYSHFYREADIPCELCLKLFPASSFLNHQEACRG